MKFKEFINEAGFLTEEGKKNIFSFRESLNDLLLSFEMTDNQLSIFSSVFIKEMNDTISKLQQNMRNDKNNLNKMTDEEYEAYMISKYGENHLLMSITQTERERAIETIKFKELAAKLQEDLEKLNNHGTKGFIKYGNFK